MKFGNFVTEFLHKGYWLLVIEVRAHNAVAIKGFAPSSLRGEVGLGPNRGAAGADYSGLDFLDTFLSRKKYHTPAR